MDEKIVALSRVLRMHLLTSPAAHTCPRLSYLVSVLVLMLAMIAMIFDGVIILADLASAFGLLPRADHDDASTGMRLLTIAAAALMYISATACAVEAKAVLNAQR